MPCLKLGNNDLTFENYNWIFLFNNKQVVSISELQSSTT